MDATGQQHVIKHIEIINQLKILKHQADLLQAKKSPCGILQLCDACVVNPDAAGIRRQDSGDQIQKCGLP